MTFQNLNVTPASLDKLLLSVDANRHEIDVQLRVDPSTQTLYATPREAWKNDAILGFRRKRWINCLKPVRVAIGTFCELPHPLYSSRWSRALTSNRTQLLIGQPVCRLRAHGSVSRGESITDVAFLWAQPYHASNQGLLCNTLVAQKRHAIFIR